MLAALDGYGVFLVKYGVLQAIRLATSLSFLVAIYAMRSSLDITKLHKFELTTSQLIVFGSLGALNVVGRLTPFASRLLIDRFKESLQAAQATAAFAKLFELPHGAVLTTPTGEFGQLIAKVFRNLDPLLPALYGAVIPIFVETVVAVIFVGVAYGPITLVQLALVVIYTLTAYRFARAKAQRNKDMMTCMLSEWGKIMASAGAYERAHFFGNVGFEISATRGRFETMGAKITAVMAGEQWEGMCQTLISLLVMAANVVLVFLVVDASTIEIFSLIAYLVIFTTSLDAYALGISNLRTAVYEYQAFDAFIHRLSDVSDVEGAVELPLTSSPTIEFANVSFSYGGRVILDDVSFKVEGGQRLGLVGASGCGKSTIMRLLLRFYRPSSGTITIDGQNIERLSGASLRRLFSVVTQDSQMFNATLRENLAYGKTGASDDELLEAAKLAELPLRVKGCVGAERASDLSLDKECGEKGAKLSGGQQQRVALARAILKSGTIYLLDEPTTGLDGVVAKQIQKTLDALSENVTTVMITHHLDDLKHAHSILYLDQGKVIERGNFESLIAAKGAFYRQVEARKRGE